MISGFYKPDEGTIEIDGKEYTNMSTADAIAAGIQVIYQDFSIFPNLTVMENLAFNQVLAEKKKFVNKKEFRKIAEEAVKKINFDVDLDARVETLPVADKQLIAISRALLHNAKLIIMDEPTTALDVTVQAQILELLKKLTKEKGTSVIMITHDLGVVASMCDRIAIMYAGQIVEEGTVDEIFYEPHHPYTKGLLNSINNSAKDNDEPLVPIPGTPPDLLKLPKGCAFMSRCPYTMKICEVQASPVTTYSETHCCRCWLECMDETKITVSREEVSCQ